MEELFRGVDNVLLFLHRLKQLQMQLPKRKLRKVITVHDVNSSQREIDIQLETEAGVSRSVMLFQVHSRIVDIPIEFQVTDLNDFT